MKRYIASDYRPSVQQIKKLKPLITEILKDANTMTDMGFNLTPMEAGQSFPVGLLSTGNKYTYVGFIINGVTFYTNGDAPVVHDGLNAKDSSADWDNYFLEYFGYFAKTYYEWITQTINEYMHPNLKKGREGTEKALQQVSTQLDNIEEQLKLLGIRPSQTSQ